MSYWPAEREPARVRPRAVWAALAPHDVLRRQQGGERAAGAIALWPHAGLAARYRGTGAVWLEPEWRASGRAAMLEEIVAIAGERRILQV